MFSARVENSTDTIMAVVVVMLLLIGTGLGFLRFVLDDKWNALPKRLCRFCATSWTSVPLSAVVFVINDHTIVNGLICLGGIPLVVVLASFSYVYIKNAS